MTSDDTVFYNCHVHLVRDRDSPERFLGDFTSILRKIRFLKIIPGIGPVLRMAGKTSKEILDTLIKKYERYNKKFRNEKFKIRNIKKYQFVVLPMDFSEMGAGELIEYEENGCLKRRNLEEQLEEILALNAGKYDDRNDNEIYHYKGRIIPFLPVEPRRNYEECGSMIEYIEYWLKKGYKGIKIYPALGYFPWHPELMRLYDFIQKKELNVPILTHTSVGMIYYRGDDLKRLIETALEQPPHYNGKKVNVECWELIKTYLKLYTTKSGHVRNKLLCGVFSHPINWLLVLKEFPNLKVNLAHFGGLREVRKYNRWKNQPLRVANNWFSMISNMIKAENTDGTPKYPNLYTDVSATWGKRRFHTLLNQTLLDTKLLDRVLFGSDFYNNQIIGYEINFAKHLRDKIGNKFNTIAQLNPKKFLQGIK